MESFSDRQSCKKKKVTHITPWKFNSSPLNIYHPKKERLVSSFQPSFFQRWNVELREGSNPFKNLKLIHKNIWSKKMDLAIHSKTIHFRNNSLRLQVLSSHAGAAAGSGIYLTDSAQKAERRSLWEGP